MSNIDQLIKWDNSITEEIEEIEMCKYCDYFPRYIKINQSGIYNIAGQTMQCEVGDIIDMNEYCDKRYGWIINKSR